MLSFLIRTAEKRTTIKSLKLEVSLPCFEVLRIPNLSFGTSRSLKTKGSKKLIKILQSLTSRIFRWWFLIWRRNVLIYLLYQNVWVSKSDFQSRTLTRTNSLLPVCRKEYQTSLKIPKLTVGSSRKQSCITVMHSIYWHH